MLYSLVKSKIHLPVVKNNETELIILPIIKSNSFLFKLLLEMLCYTRIDFILNLNLNI